MSAPLPTDATRDEVGREIDAPASRVFALLADPARHRELDGVRMIREPREAAPITAVGQSFRMEMTRRLPGREPEDYVVDNRVVAFEPDRELAWRPGVVGEQEFGWEWRFRLTPLDDGRTRVTQVFDWTDTPQETLDAVGTPMPSIPRKYRERTLERLAALVEEPAPPAPEG